MNAAAFAPAKVNLFLHVGPLQPDGFHPVCSLMAFADVGDRLSLQPAGGLSLRIEGTFAAELAGHDPEKNLVIRAARAFADAAGVAVSGAFVLEKSLPVASGLGGGSSDAGAALRLLRGRFAPSMPDAELEALAAAVGSDGPACLWGRPVLGEGRGDMLTPAPRLPDLPAVLVNPGEASPTGPVYRGFDAAPPGPGADCPLMPAVFTDMDGLVEVLSACRNDLEGPAALIAPGVGAVLASLRAAPETRLARVSGSGATCFALCDTGAAARRLAARLSAAQPSWWVRTCRLGGPWPDGALSAA